MVESTTSDGMGKVDTETENSRYVDMQAIETAEAPAAPPSSRKFTRRASIDSQWIERGSGVGRGWCCGICMSAQSRMVLLPSCMGVIGAVSERLID